MIFQKFFSFKPLGNMEENLYSWLLFLHSSLPPPPHGSFLSVLMWITKGEIISLKFWVHFNASTLFSVFWEHCGLLWVFSFLNSCRFVVTDSCQNPSQTLDSWFTCPCMIFFSWMWAGPSEFFLMNKGDEISLPQCYERGLGLSSLLSCFQAPGVMLRAAL